MSTRRLLGFSSTGEWVIAPLSDLADVDADFIGTPEPPGAFDYRTVAVLNSGKALRMDGATLYLEDPVTRTSEDVITFILEDGFASGVSASPDGQRIAVTIAMWPSPIVLLSNDGGATFVERPTGLDGLGILDAWAGVTDTPGELILVGYGEGTVVFRSADAGLSWTQYGTDGGFGFEAIYTNVAQVASYVAAGRIFGEATSPSGMAWQFGPGGTASMLSAPNRAEARNYAGNVAFFDYWSGDDLVYFNGSSFAPQPIASVRIASNLGPPITGGAGGANGLYVSNTDGTWGWIELPSDPAYAPRLAYFIIGEGDPIVPAFWTDFTNSYEIP